LPHHRSGDRVELGQRRDGGLIAFCQGDSPTAGRLASYAGNTVRSLLIR
jgi:hypothetical protein